MLRTWLWLKCWSIGRPIPSSSQIWTMRSLQNMASSAGMKAASAPNKQAGQTSYFNTRDGMKKRLFGGANNRNSKDPAIMAKLKGKAVGMYGESKGTWYVGGGPTAWNRFNTDAQPDRQVVTPKARPRLIPNIKPISGNAGGGGPREGQGRRIFGGANSRNSNNPAIMARLKGKGTAMYGTMSGNTPLRIGAKR